MQNIFIQYLKKYQEMATSDFINQLSQMVEKQTCIGWNADGTEFEIKNLKKFKDQVLTTYFRQPKLQSFIRQLNMYGFHKVNRRKDALIFHHQFFTRSRPEDLYLIKRAKKNKEKVKKQNIASPVFDIVPQKLKGEAPNLAELLTRLIEFNTQNNFDHRNLKSQLEALSKELSSKKLRVIRPIINEIKERLSYLEEIKKRIGQIDFQNLISSAENTPTKQNSMIDSRSPFSIKTPRCISAPVIPYNGASESKSEICWQNQFQSVKSISNLLNLS